MANTGLNGKSAVLYGEVKKAIFYCYDVIEETHRRRFRLTRSCQKNSSRIGEIVSGTILITKDQKMSSAELMVLNQLLGGVPEDLKVGVFSEGRRAGPGKWEAQDNSCNCPATLER